MNVERRRWGRSVDEHRSVLRTAHAHASQSAWYQGGPAEGGSGVLNLKLKRSPGGYELRAIKAMLGRMRVVGGLPGDSVRRRDLGGEQGKFNKAGNENVQNCGSMHFVQLHTDIVAMTRSQDWSEKHEGKIYRESQVLKRKRIKTIK
ncbi:hypothetical protein TEQG_01155 [Trichophyton equinum CBS 127.97]|uniref:Uncharacterized protein n=1 Tax=Trichophyton equinum (strain ATCC MYA-4606 / CBS 127.97) TaxID=559882 RepID=F2PJP8_TRIEC|nr:hypothetical protein TEQG_01155 [Trichophyton equinum CBS 127.97]